MAERVAGCCPMGCGETLFLGSGGFVTCSYLDCPRPDAVADLLGDRERERLDDALMECELHAWIAARPGPPAKPGRYRVRWQDSTGVNSWEPVRCG